MSRPQPVLAGTLLAALVALVAAGSRAEERIFTPLAAHTFDEGASPTGPDTFRVFESNRGSVTRTTHFRWSGEFSVELRDVPGNGDFPELLGFFDRRTSGQVYVHFAFLVVDPRQELNIALIGARGFRLEKDGFAFWLYSKRGRLFHRSDSMPKRLVDLQPFTWYSVDLLYDVDLGTYTLVVEEEGKSEPIVSLVDQPNAANQPGSNVDKFSFVSDPFEDLSAVVYYVDDIVIGADAEIDLPAFVAPGRRSFFVERYLQSLLAEYGEHVRQAAPDPWLELMAAGEFAAALREAETALRADAASARWLERAGDAAFLGGNAALALLHYDGAVAAQSDTSRLMLKRADAHFLLGDLASEKRLRQAIYGTLEAVAPTTPDR